MVLARFLPAVPAVIVWVSFCSLSVRTPTERKFVQLLFLSLCSGFVGGLPFWKAFFMPALLLTVLQQRETAAAFLRSDLAA